MPKISVVMPVYNTKEEWLREAIESILNQSYKDFEFIIIDDGSDKSIEPIVNSYNDARIVLIRQENQRVNILQEWILMIFLCLKDLKSRLIFWIKILKYLF